MRIFKKVTAVILSLVMVASLVGCNMSLTKQWSYKDENQELSIGVYIYSLYQAYSQASNFAKEAEGYEENKSFLNLKIKDDDGNEAIAKDWILDEADTITKSLLAIDQEILKLGAKSSPDQITAAQDNATSYWEEGGPYAAYYAQMGYSAPIYKDMLEPFGISYDSFYIASSLASVKQDTLFKAIYDKGGTKETADKDIHEYFEKNYTDYSYFTVSLAESSTDSDGNATSTALPEDKQKAIKSNLDKYVKMINNDKKSYKDVITQYMKDYKDITADPTQAATEILDNNTSMSDDIKKAIKGLDNNKATVIKTGTDTSASYVFIYKTAIKDKTTEYFKTANNRLSVLASMKNDEFNEYIKDLIKNVKCEINTGAVNKYDPKMFEDFSKATPSATS